MSSFAIPSRHVLGMHTPSASWEQPLDMLRACHARVHRMLELLTSMQVYWGNNGLDEQVRQAAVDVMRYFDHAAPLHHQDEELHIFPKALDSDEPTVIAAIKILMEQHQVMESLWQGLRTQLDRMIQYQSGSMLPDAIVFESFVSRFLPLYRDHMDAEEQIVYPCVEQRASTQDLHFMGLEMATRRGALLPEQPHALGRQCTR